uniref:ATP synthase F0 subunit 8 n=1 Tax=Nymphon brevicaudatum TaxID=373287 RepID=UPI00226C76A6|nr:ATP synthase F0 subunit 8 [Nymphon brevicaudatum]UZA61316.1 ATP synthase F0 subunit 8 [Nymphon brevicaudatum]
MSYISNIYFPAMLFVPMIFYFSTALFNSSKILKTKNMMVKINLTKNMMLLW